MKCSNCGEEVADDSRFCHYCGAKCTNEAKKRTVIWPCVAIVILIGAAVAVGIFKQNIIGYDNDHFEQPLQEYFLTNNGVDILQLNRPLVKDFPMDAVYDSVSISKDEYYVLYKHGKVVAYASLINGVVDHIYIVSPNIVTDNGIHVGMTMRECVSKKGVESIIGYDYSWEKPCLWTIYDTIGIENSMKFSDEGLAKWNRMLQEVKKAHESGNDANCSIILEPSDFQAEDTVSSLQIILCSELSPSNTCELNGTDPELIEELRKMYYSRLLTSY